MTPNADALFHAAMALPAEERVALAERLFESVDQSEMEAAWAAEAEARLTAYDQGRVSGIPAEEVHRSLPPRMPS
jgi:putative addiction module component (TIGR02574 family)